MGVPHNLRVHADLVHPRQYGICDRCSFLYFLDDLPFQYDQRGNSVTNTGLRVCERCYDLPATILKPVVIIGPEGVGQKNPRPTKYAQNNAAGPSPQLPFTPGNPMAPVVQPQPGGSNIAPPNEWTVQGLAEQVYRSGYPGI
jgi:hypothetical protein